MSKTLLTDLYQLTMNAAYFYSGKNDEATFDLFIRSLPEDWGYYIACGIEDALDYLLAISFEEEDIGYLKKQGFEDDYCDFLRGFRFEGDACALREGTPVFPQEPLIRITAPRMQAQFVETALLNSINFQTMVAAKTSRIVTAAEGAGVVDFGLRRAHEEDAAVKGSRAAYLAGALATSNVKAGKLYDIPVAGTHAHSFVMSFPSEIDSFRAYVKTFPDRPTLLIDTYDTLQGARNAAAVAREMERSGEHRLGAVRLDSGDLPRLAREVRAYLDGQGLSYVKIVASNDLNEYLISGHRRLSAPIDLYGVGTELITARPVAAVPGVYKLVEDCDGPKIKLSAHKHTLPGKKQIFRQADAAGTFVRDIIACDYESLDGQPLLEKAIEGGRRIRDRTALPDARQHCLDCVSRLPEHIKKLSVTQPYEVGLSPALQSLVHDLEKRYGV